MEKQQFFRAATAGLGKFHTGGYGRIGVYRVKPYSKFQDSILKNSKVYLTSHISLLPSIGPAFQFTSSLNRVKPIFQCKLN